MLGTYRLQDPMGKELGSLVHGNRLVKANVDGDELRKMWTQPSVKDTLRRRNNIPEKDFVLSTDDNSQILTDFLSSADIDDIVQIEDDSPETEMPLRQPSVPSHIPILRPLSPTPPSSPGEMIEVLSGPPNDSEWQPAGLSGNTTPGERPLKRQKKTPPLPTRQSERRRQPSRRYT